MPQVVLVTGVARYLGARFAKQLSERAEAPKVIGVDVVPPALDLGNAEFIQADIREPVTAPLLDGYGVDTVVHMNVLATPRDAGGRVPQKEINVIGTMQLLAGCQRAESVRRVVVKSSATVYGASPRDPAMFTEDMAPKKTPRSGFAKDSIEVESYVRGFARRRPDVQVTTLRFANFVGPDVRTPLTEYFVMPVIPVVLGHDARLQFIHEDDGLRAIAHATTSGAVGTFNIAGDGVVTLSQAARLAGRPALPLPGPTTSAFGGLLTRANLASFSPEQVQFMTYGRGVDTTRMRTEFGFEPDYTTRAAFESFVAARCRDGWLDRDRVNQAERAVTGLLDVNRG